MVSSRLYQLQPVALEIFSKNGGTTLLVFEDKKTKAAVEGLLSGNAGGRVLEGVVAGNGAWLVDPGTGRLNLNPKLSAWLVDPETGRVEGLGLRHPGAGRATEPRPSAPVSSWFVSSLIHLFC